MAVDFLPFSRDIIVYINILVDDIFNLVGSRCGVMSEQGSDPGEC